jgi:hypothetical protein
MRASTMIKPTVQRVAGLLGPCGFRKRAHRFNRPVADDGLVHVIALQLASHRGFEPPGSLGLMPAYYGTYTLNIGVYIPELARTPPSQGGWVADYQCTIHQRIGTLLPGRQDTWWPVGSVDAADVVLDALSTRVLPWLDRLASVEAILRIHELAPEMLGSQRALWPCELYLSRGHTEQAHRAFTDFLVHASLDASRLAMLRGWLHERGLPEWEPILDATAATWRAP